MLRIRGVISAVDFFELSSIMRRKIALYGIVLKEAEINEIKIKGYSPIINPLMIDEGVISTYISHLGLRCIELSILDDEDRHDKVEMTISLNNEAYS